MKRQLPDFTFRRKLIRLVMPIAFQQFMLALVSASDALMLGSIDQDALSAVSLAGQITFVYNLFLAAMTIGTNILAAQYWGKQDVAAVEKLLGIVLRISVLISGIFAVAALLFPAALMRIFTADAALTAYGAEYLRIVGITYFLCGISQIYFCIMKNSGHAAESMAITCVTVVLNILLNAVLIYGLACLPRMGVAGAALATLLSRIVELVWVLVLSLKKDHIRMRFDFIRRPDRILRKDFWKYTLPVLGNELVWGIAFTMYSVILGHLGSDAVAANSIASIVRNLIACFCIGLGSGGGIIVGNELGAGQLKRAKEYGHRLCILSLISGALSGLVILCLIPVILRCSNLTPQANHYLLWMLVMCSYYIIGQAINTTTIAGIFCAGGDSRFGLLCDSVVMWCIVVPLGFISAFWLELPVIAVYFVINLDEIFKLPAVYRHYRKYHWVKDLTNDAR